MGVCISKGLGSWDLNFPLFVFTDGWKPIYRHDRSLERIQYLRDRRNRATTEALLTHPGTTDIVAVDSYYLHQTAPLQRLIMDYSRMEQECIMGASTWAVHKIRIFPRTYFYDTWSTPEMENFYVTNVNHLPNGVRRVSSVGACYIFPRSVWDRGVRYEIPEYPREIFHNHLCKASGLPVYLDFDARLWRTPSDSDVPVYSRIKRVRCSLGEWRRKILRGISLRVTKDM